MVYFSGLKYPSTYVLFSFSHSYSATLAAKLIIKLDLTTL